ADSGRCIQVQSTESHKYEDEQDQNRQTPASDSDRADNRQQQTKQIQAATDRCWQTELIRQYPMQNEAKPDEIRQM
ncbi:hypothetical protein Tco_1415971, partial [Tanacetum coccineum]